MKIPKGSILQVAAIMALATGVALTTSCSNSGNTNSATDTVAVNTMSTMKADSMKADSMKSDTMKAKSATAPMPKKTKGVGMVNEPVPPPIGEIVEDKDEVYNHAEVEPLFPGGQSALDDYVKDNIHYPGKAMDNDIEGKVVVHFVVDQHGNVTDVTTIGQPLGYGLEEEAIRVMSTSPKWTPGKVKGKNVKTMVQVPIVFKLL